MQWEESLENIGKGIVWGGWVNFHDSSFVYSQLK